MGLFDTLFAGAAGAAQAYEGAVQKENEFNRQISLAEYKHQKDLEREKIRAENDRLNDQINRAYNKSDRAEERNWLSGEKEKDRKYTETKEEEDRARTKAERLEEEERRDKKAQTKDSQKEIIESKNDQLTSTIQDVFDEDWKAKQPSADGGGIAGGLDLSTKGSAPPRPPQFGSIREAQSWAASNGYKDIAEKIEKWLSLSQRKGQKLSPSEIDRMFGVLFEDLLDNGIGRNINTLPPKPSSIVPGNNASRVQSVAPGLPDLTPFQFENQKP